VALESALVGRSPGYRRATVVRLNTPEAGVFYVTFVLQFVPPGADVAAYSFLSGLHVLLTLGRVRHPDRRNHSARQTAAPAWTD